MDHRCQSFAVYFRSQNSGQDCLTSSLRSWTLNRCTSASLQMIKSGGVPSRTEGCADIHNRQKKWAEELHGAPQGEMKSLNLGRSNSIHHQGLEADWLESSSDGKDPGVLNINEQPQRPRVSWAPLGRITPADRGAWCFSTQYWWDASWMLASGLGFPALNMDTGVGPWR